MGRRRVVLILRHRRIPPWIHRGNDGVRHTTHPFDMRQTERPWVVHCMGNQTGAKNQIMANGYASLPLEKKRALRREFWENVLIYIGAQPCPFEPGAWRLGQWKYWPEKATCKCDTEPMKTGIHWGLWRQGKFPLMYQCKKKNCWRKAFREYCKLW